MTTDALSQIVEQSLKKPDWSKLKVNDDSYWLNIAKGALGAIPVAGGLAAEGLQVYFDYKDNEFFRKFTRFLLGLEETTEEERNKFAQEIQKKADDFSGNVILGLIDRLDNINKEAILAKLTIAKIKGDISIEDFFRLHSILERIPYVDLKELPKYKEPYYDEHGDTELLYATGALELVTLDSKGGPNKYILSRLGELLLLIGYGMSLGIEHGKGTNVELDTMTEEEMDELFDKKAESLRPRIEGEKLILP